MNRDDIFDSIAEMLPPRKRTQFWKAVARLKRLRDDDDTLAVLHVMGVITEIMYAIPVTIILERKAIERLVKRLEALLADWERKITTGALYVHRPIKLSSRKLPPTG